MLRRENTEGLESERPLPCMGVTAPIRAHNSYYGPCPNGQKSPCYSVLILHFFQKALPRPNRESPECEQVPRALRDLLWDFTYLCFNQEGGSVTQASKRGKT